MAPDDALTVPQPRPSLSEQGKQILRDAFAAVPANKRGALVLIADEQGARFAVAAKLADGWKVANTVTYAPHQPVAYQVAVMGAW